MRADHPFAMRPFAVAAALVLVAAAFPPIVAADWPMWRCDANRSGASTEQLPDALHLQWTLELPAPRPAWPSTQDKLQFDRLYEPVLHGKRIFVPSMVRDKVSAYDTDTGAELWTFYCDGPVRLAPVAAHGKVWFASDDGHLYCVAADSGALLWKFRGGPSDRRVVGNERLVNMWPARGGPVLRDGKIYFGAGIWPFMGIFLHALDADTGEVVWTQSGEGSRYQTQQHNSPAFAGVAPQGYIAATEDKLVVAGGRTMPAVYDRHTGAFLHYDVSNRTMGSKGGGGYEVCVAGNYYLNRGIAYRLDNGKYFAKIDALIATPDVVIGRNAGGICAFEPRFTQTVTKDKKGKKQTKASVRTLWSTPLDRKIDQAFILAAGKLYCRAGNAVLAVDITNIFTGARTTWSADLPDRPLNMICGDGKLFVATASGRIYCFGGNSSDATPPPIASAKSPATPEKTDATNPDRCMLVERGSVWRFHDTGGDPGADWRSLEFDDGGWKEGPARLGYGNDGEKTVVSYGGNAKRKFAASFFRHEFEAPSDSGGPPLSMRVWADDGAVLYLNGTEVTRLRMASGEVGHATFAATGLSNEKSVDEVDVPVGLLREGRNVIAASVHQSTRTSSDLGFDLEMICSFVEKKPIASPTAVESADAATALLTRWIESNGSKARAADMAGYAVVLGLGDGRLAEDLAVRSKLHVIAVESDAERVASFRRRLDKIGLYGERVTVVVDDPAWVSLPPYFAELITAEPETVDSLDASVDGIRRLFASLRPFSGRAILPLDDSDHEAFAGLITDAGLDGGEVERSGRWSLLARTRALTGAGNWTHQNASAANSVASTDTIVRAPLGLLWFGGPSNANVLPRHGHGPTPQVVDGRCFIEGRDMIRATDAYTGRLLWQRDLKDVGKFYDYTSHEPGANILGSNYVSLPDGVWVAWGRRCLRLDPATGATLAELQLPKAGEKDLPEWGYIGIADRFLIAGAQPLLFDSPDIPKSNVDGLKDAALKKWKASIDALVDFEHVPRRKRGKADVLDKQYIWNNLLKLFFSADLPSHIPLRVRYKVDMEKTENELAKYLSEVPGRQPTDRHALLLKRKLLNKYYGLADYARVPAGKTGSLARSASKRLVIFDRNTGKVLWEREARHQIRHNAIAAGRGTVFYLDRMSAEERSHFRRRGKTVEEHSSLAAIDLVSGDVRWTAADGIFGTWLGYSVEHDVLLQAGSKSRDRSKDEIGKGITAYRGATGDVLWRSDATYEGPLVIVGETIFTQGHGTAGVALKLATGEKVKRAHPLTGTAIDWQYKRNYGCNTAIGAPNLLTFRSAAAGYYDLLGDSGTGNLGGFRTGCTSNLIPAGGILCAPDYTRTCTCSYQNQSSVALIHMPEVEMWTFNALGSDAAPVRQLGLNFGAPGDRRGPDGTLWLDYPSVGGDSPSVPVELKIDKPGYHRHHASVVLDLGESADRLDWVAASAVEGSGEIAIEIVPQHRVTIANDVDGAPAIRAESAALSDTIPPNGSDAGRASLRKARGGGKVDAKIDAHASLALRGSLTVEFRTRVDSDLDYVDARIASAKSQHGFVIDNRTLRLRYFPANADGTGKESVVTISNDKKRLKDNTWVHVAFTYDLVTGEGKLWADGELVGSHDGPDGRPLWWEKDAPTWAVLQNAANHNSFLDDLRVCDIALNPTSFLGGEPVDAKHVVGRWRMEGGQGDGHSSLYTVRLVFAEVGGAAAGERRFDVHLQGEPRLEDFDIARDAGGAFRQIVKEFRDVPIEQRLRIRLVGKDGRLPLLSGVQIVNGKQRF